MAGVIEWIVFLALSAVAIVTAASVLLTMSMYRAGLALMSSFVALAGLFVLLDADLLAAIQIMMNVGGMLVMVLFMVMAMMDPGGEMMWDMKRSMNLRGPGALSMTMPRTPPPPESDDKNASRAGEANGDVRAAHDEHAADWTCPMHPEVSRPGPGECPKCGMRLVPRSETGTQQQTGGEGTGEHAATEPGGQHGGMAMGGMSPRAHYQMMADMAMSTTQLPWALALAAASTLVLAVLYVRTAWPLSSVGPSRDATVAIGELLLSRYMIAFEGAAFLILAGMVGAVIFGKREVVGLTAKRGRP
jgi:NADH:ubiquinone oxidoreductase subunit 6 (subunit J)